MKKKLLRYPVDKWAVGLIVSVFLTQLAIYLFVANVWLMLGAAVLLLPFCISVIAYNHNHIHTLTFVQAMPNRLLEVLMFFETGQSPFSGTLNHIFGHHATYFDPKIDTLNWRRPDGSVMTRNEFSVKAALRHYQSCFFFGRQRPNIFRRFKFYLAVCLALLAGLILYKPVAALIVYLMPMTFMLYMLKWAAYSHHSGLPIGDHYTASRTNTGRFYNWATWNAGYHAAHHFRQALHWSLLPAYHREKLADKIPSELQGEGWGEQFARAAGVDAAT